MSANSNSSRSKASRPAPSAIEYKNMKFLITDRPTDFTMPSYIEELKKHCVQEVVRVCEPTYKIDDLRNDGIAVTDLEFDDGTFPPTQVVADWLNLLRECNGKEPGVTVAVHCVAGLGRAPVLVAIALMELGMRYEDAVELIRRKRRGAVNAKQLAYLSKYRPKSRLKLRKLKKNGKKEKHCCLQ